MTESGPTATFSTTGELAGHLADRARGTAAGAGDSRRLLDILSPLFQRTEEIVKSIAAADGRYSGNTAHDELETLLERCERDAVQAGNSTSDIEDAALAVVAWIDETISAALSGSTPDAEEDNHEDPFRDPDAPDAPDSESQEIYRLQTSRFEISDAGVRVFEKLSALADEQGEVREVYVAVLELGFRGQYFAEDDRRQLDGLKQEHAERLLTVTPRPEVTKAGPSAPATKAAQIEGRSRWKMVAAAAVFIAVVGAGFAYNWYAGCAAIYGADCTYCTLNPENCFH